MDQQALVERASQGDHEAFGLVIGARLARLDTAARLILRETHSTVVRRVVAPGRTDAYPPPMIGQRPPRLLPGRYIRQSQTGSHGATGRAPGAGWKAAVLVAGALLLLSFLPGVADASVGTWTARLGTAGAYGTVAITRDAAGAFRAVVSVRHLHRSAAYDVRVDRGSCSVLGKAVTTPLMRFRTTASGTYRRTAAITGAKGVAILAALSAGRVAMRVGTHCGYVLGPVPKPTPTPTPTPTPSLPAGLGVPVMAPDKGELIVLAAEPWTDPVGDAAADETLVTLEIFETTTDAGPITFTLRDSAYGDHTPLAGGRTPVLPAPPATGIITGWLTFTVPTAVSTDVTLRWSVSGTVYEVPLHVAPPAVSPLALSRATTTGLEGAQVAGAVGTPTGYVAGGWTQGPAPMFAVTSGIWTSADGVAWKSRSVPGSTGAAVNAVARGSSGRIVAAGYVTASGIARAAIWTSTDDGGTWARVPGLPTDTAVEGRWHGITEFGTGFAVVGSVVASGQAAPHAAALTSIDGLHWTRSTTVEAANCRSLDGVVEGGPGLIGWGTLWDCDTVAYGATAWWSTAGASWTKAVDAADFVSNDRGGATSRRMELVFGSTGDWTAIATWVDSDGRPLVYSSTDGKSWAPGSVGAALRQFWPAAAAQHDAGWLLGGFGVADAGTGYSYQPQAWFGKDASWVRVPVDLPIPATSATAEYRIKAFASGPAGMIAIGDVTDVGAVSPVPAGGQVWTIGPTP